MNAFYDIVFVVLVYRNTEDLESFFKSLKVRNCKVIVVNSYFDDKTENIFKEISQRNDAVFISVPNKGYGAGNNCGCDYAINNFSFNHLIISNADIEISCLNAKLLSNNKITAPEILNRRGKRQNPARAYCLPKYDWLMYLFYKKNISIGIYACCIINKIVRYIFYMLNRIFGCKNIYEAHGAFIIIPYSVLKTLHPLFNEEMFLFAEEDHLAKLAKVNNVKIEYNKNVVVHHKEDGSVGLMNVQQTELTKKSYITYYEFWYKNK